MYYFDQLTVSFSSGDLGAILPVSYASRPVPFSLLSINVLLKHYALFYLYENSTILQWKH